MAVISLIWVDRCTGAFRHLVIAATPDFFQEGGRLLHLLVNILISLVWTVVIKAVCSSVTSPHGNMKYYLTESNPGMSQNVLLTNPQAVVR
jgi:hypothetical protein